MNAGKVNPNKPVPNLKPNVDEKGSVAPKALKAGTVPNDTDPAKTKDTEKSKDSKKVHETEAKTKKAEENQKEQILKTTLSDSEIVEELLLKQSKNDVSGTAKAAMPVPAASLLTTADPSLLNKIGITGINPKMSLAEINKELSASPNSEKSKALKKMLGLPSDKKEIAAAEYTKYEVAYNEFQIDLRVMGGEPDPNLMVASSDKDSAVQAKGRSISYQEYVLFTYAPDRQRFTEKSWDGIAGSTKDGIVNEGEDSELDLQELQAAAKVVEGYNKFLATDKLYQEFESFIEVDISKIESKFNELENHPQLNAGDKNKSQFILDKLAQHLNDPRAREIADSSNTSIDRQTKFFILYLMLAKKNNQNVTSRAQFNYQVMDNTLQKIFFKRAAERSAEKKAKTEEIESPEVSEAPAAAATEGKEDSDEKNVFKELVGEDIFKKAQFQKVFMKALASRNMQTAKISLEEIQKSPEYAQNKSGVDGLLSLINFFINVKEAGKDEEKISALVKEYMVEADQSKPLRNVSSQVFGHMGFNFESIYGGYLLEEVQKAKAQNQFDKAIEKSQAYQEALKEAKASAVEELAKLENKNTEEDLVAATQLKGNLANLETEIKKSQRSIVKLQVLKNVASKKFKVTYKENVNDFVFEEAQKEKVHEYLKELAKKNKDKTVMVSVIDEMVKGPKAAGKQKGAEKKSEAMTIVQKMIKVSNFAMRNDTKKIFKSHDELVDYIKSDAVKKNAEKVKEELVTYFKKDWTLASFMIRLNWKDLSTANEFKKQPKVEDLQPFSDDRKIELINELVEHYLNS